jgi:hypothetical protein
MATDEGKLHNELALIILDLVKHIISGENFVITRINDLIKIIQEDGRRTAFVELYALIRLD